MNDVPVIRSATNAARGASRLSNGSINKTLVALCQILDRRLSAGLIASNCQR